MFYLIDPVDLNAFGPFSTGEEVAQAGEENSVNAESVVLNTDDSGVPKITSFDEFVDSNTNDSED